MKEKLTLYAIKQQVTEYYSRNNKIPSSTELSETFEDTPERIEKYLKFLREKDFIRRDEHGAEYVVIDNIPPELPEVAESLPFNPEEIKQASEQLRQFTGIKKQILINKSMIPMLRYVMFFIGISSMYLSIEFSFLWIKTFLSPFKAMVMAITMVVFGVMCFELIPLLWGRFQRKLAGVFGVLSTVVICFSMVSTVAGQYNNRMEQIQERSRQNAGAWESEKEYSEYKEQRAELDKQVETLRSEDSRLTALLLNYQTIEQIEGHKAVYNQLNNAKWQNARQQGQLQKKIEALEKTKPKAVQARQEQDFYMWVGAVLGVSPDKFQFWLSLFPALFIDLAAPLSIAVFLFVRKQEGEV